MGSAYPNSFSSTSWSPRKLQNSHVETALDVARGLIGGFQNLWGPAGRRRRRGPAWLDARSVARSVFTVTTLLAVLWMYVLWWGERTVFRQSVNECLWEKWESWVRYSTSLHGEPLERILTHDHSPPMQYRIMSSSWRIRNWSIPIHIPADLGLCRP